MQKTLQTPIKSVSQPAWKNNLRRRIAMLLAVKLVALILMRGFFFAPEHRVHVTGPAMGAALGMDAPNTLSQDQPND